MDAIGSMLLLVVSDLEPSCLHMRLFVKEDSLDLLMFLSALADEEVLDRADVLQTGHVTNFPPRLPVDHNLRLALPDLKFALQGRRLH